MKKATKRNSVDTCSVNQNSEVGSGIKDKFRRERPSRNAVMLTADRAL